MNHFVIHPSGRCFATFKSFRFCPTLYRVVNCLESQCHTSNLMPGSSLLSHGETPHYHRRYGVSLLSSAWGQVGPPRYSRQANSVYQHTSWACRCYLYQAENISLSPKHLRRCKVKPHGSLVSVSSMYRYTYTPDLSTSSSSTFLQDP